MAGPRRRCSATRRSTRLVGLLARDGRARRAPDRRRAARAPRAVAARRAARRRRERPRPLADHQRLPARAPGREARARRPAPRQRLARRARARPLLPAHAPRLARSRCSTASRRPRSTPSCARSRSTSSRSRTSPRTRSSRFAEFARKHPYEVRFIEFMPLDADRTWSRDRVLPNAEVRRLIHAAYPLEGPRPRAPRHLAALGVRRRAGLDRLHLPRVASRSAATATASA